MKTKLFLDKLLSHCIFMVSCGLIPTRYGQMLYLILHEQQLFTDINFLSVYLMNEKKLVKKDEVIVIGDSITSESYKEYILNLLD